MKELYFHIGLHKTGTSALQKFFDINRDALRKKGIYYPKGDVEQRKDNVLIYNGIATNIKGFGLLGKVIDEFGAEELSFIDDLKSMFDSDDIVLFSSEMYLGEMIKILSALSTFLEPENIAIKIIVYLRRQDEHIESWWHQDVKGFKCLCENCWEFAQEKIVNFSFYDYSGLLLDISKIVGKENIICRIYAPEKYSAENTIYAEFMQIFGIDDISDFELPKFQVNPSLSKNMVEIRRIFNSISGANNLFPVLWGIRGRESAYTKSEEKIVKHPSFLTYEQRKYILDYFEESNINLGREYFGIDGSPFAPLEKTVEDDEEDENDNSMYGDVIAFLGEILVKQQEKIENLDERLSYVTDEFELSKEIPDDSRIVVYGARRKGRVVYNWLKRNQKYQALCIADQRADELQSFGLPICQPQEIFKMQYDYILISVDTKKTEDSIQQYLEENEVERERIIRVIG